MVIFLTVSCSHGGTPLRSTVCQICKAFGFPNQIIEGNCYFCIEIYLKLNQNKVVYRIVNEYGEIACYEGAKFTIKKNQLLNMIFNGDDLYYIIRLNRIHELESEYKNINGIWGEYHEGNNKSVEKEIHDIIKQQAELERYLLPKIEIT